MSVAVIIERIQAELVSGALREAPDNAKIRPVEKLADLLNPFEEMFPGIILTSGKAITSGYSRWGRLRFTPQPRRSARPVPLPANIYPLPRPNCRPELFLSVQAIWAFYQSKNEADPELLQLDLAAAGSLDSFLAPLCDALSDYYPLGCPLEDVGQFQKLEELSGFSLMLPCYTYEEECAGMVEAFLSGPTAVASHLRYLYESKPDGGNQIELPGQDVKLIEDVGWPALTENYTKFPSKKSVDLVKLESFWEVYFSDVERDFPDHANCGWCIISGNGGQENEVWIKNKSSIDFCLAYSDAYNNLLGDLPDPYDFDYNEGGLTENFIHELCEAWRKTNNKRSVKWESPKANTLAYRYRRGDL